MDKKIKCYYVINGPARRRSSKLHFVANKKLVGHYYLDGKSTPLMTKNYYWGYGTSAAGYDFFELQRKQWKYRYIPRKIVRMLMSKDPVTREIAITIIKDKYDILLGT